MRVQNIARKSLKNMLQNGEIMGVNGHNKAATRLDGIHQNVKTLGKVGNVIDSVETKNGIVLVLFIESF